MKTFIYPFLSNVTGIATSVVTDDLKPSVTVFILTFLIELVRYLRSRNNKCNHEK